MKKTFFLESPARCVMRLIFEDSSHKAFSKKKGFLHGFMVNALVTSAKRAGRPMDKRPYAVRAWTMALLPLFPLPNVVLFPGVALPLHIFEARYRAMVADALEADRRIGMVLLQPGRWEPNYEGRPPIYPIGCSGVIASAAKLEDGRYNIVLNGLDRIRIISEDDERAYRRAIVELLPDPPLDAANREALSAVRV